MVGRKGKETECKSMISSLVQSIISFITHLVQIKAFLYDQYDRK